MLRIDDITLPFEGIHDSTLNYFVLNICLNRCGCKVLFLRHFPKGDFPSDNFPSGNFPNVQFLKRQLPKGQVMPLMCRREPSAAARQSGGGLALRLGQTWEVAAWEIAHLGSFATWENTIRKLPLVHGACNAFIKSHLRLGRHAL